MIAMQIYILIVFLVLLIFFYVPIRNKIIMKNWKNNNVGIEEDEDEVIIDFELRDLIPDPGFVPTYKVKIVTSSSPFYWYEKISKIKDDEPNAAEKIFEVEYYDKNLYRTIKDTCGPGVKGFINVTDTEVLMPYKKEYRF